MTTLTADYKAWLETLSADQRAIWQGMIDNGCEQGIMADWAQDNGGMSSFAEWAQPITDQWLADNSPWTIAERLEIGYSGDMNPVEHGGYFYSTRDWEAFGYADCVEFWEDPETGYLVVQRGVINRPNDMSSAFRCAGIEGQDTSNIHAQIDASKCYYGIESELEHGTGMKVFNLDTWKKEHRIWRSVRGWIEALGK